MMKSTSWCSHRTARIIKISSLCRLLSNKKWQKILTSTKGLKWTKLSGIWRKWNWTQSNLTAAWKWLLPINSKWLNNDLWTVIWAKIWQSKLPFKAALKKKEWVIPVWTSLETSMNKTSLRRKRSRSLIHMSMFQKKKWENSPWSN